MSKSQVKTCSSLSSTLSVPFTLIAFHKANKAYNVQTLKRLREAGPTVGFSTMTMLQFETRYV